VSAYALKTIGQQWAVRRRVKITYSTWLVFLPINGVGFQLEYPDIQAEVCLVAEQKSCANLISLFLRDS